MSVMDKLKKNTRTKNAAVLSKSEFFEQKHTPTNVPMINVALSGDLEGGITSGVTVLAGPSKHFKTSFALLMAASYLREHPEAVLLFYDTEFGSPQDYFQTFGIDTDRVLHVPIMNVEELKFELVNQLEELDKNDDVIVLIDSVGMLASKKEIEDALNEKSVADMTRAKALKGLFRMVTPYLTMKNVPLIAINHTYQEMGLFPKAVVSGGTGIYYAADNIWIIGRRQNKKGTEVEGYDFIINVEKSRFVKEKSRIPISVSWDAGISNFSGLLDVALVGGWVTKPSNGWYQKVDPSTGEVLGSKVREKDTNTEEFWEDILNDENFKLFVSGMYKVNCASEFDSEELFEQEGE